MDEKLMGDLDKDFIEDVKKFTEDGDLLNFIAQIFKTWFKNFNWWRI